MTNHFFWERDGRRIECACGQWDENYDAHARHLVETGSISAYNAGFADAPTSRELREAEAAWGSWDPLYPPVNASSGLKQAYVAGHMAAAESCDQRIKKAVLAVLWPEDNAIFEWGGETTPTFAEIEELADEIVATSRQEESKQ